MTAAPKNGSHYYVFPFHAAGLSRGWSKVTGLESSLLREISRRRSQCSSRSWLIILSDGSRGDSSVELADARVRITPATCITDPAAETDRFAFWFDQMWAYISPDAFTSASISKGMLSVLYPHRYDAPMGSLAQMFEHYEKYGVLSRNPRPTREYVDRMNTLIDTIDDGATVNWQDFFVVELIIRHAERLRRRGAFQTFHSSLPHPPELDRTAEGRKLLYAMSLVDRIYFLTDSYARTFSDHVRRLGLRSPEIRRCDLGVDRNTLDAGMGYHAAASARSCLSRLGPQQGAAVAEILATRGAIPHRFVCLDRLDNIKGIHVMIRAIDRFLARQRLGASALSRLYRFYFLMDYYSSHPPVDPRNTCHRYADYVRRLMIPELKRKYPIVVHFSDNVPCRELIPQLLQDAHVITGGIQEGLGLAVQEGLYLNASLGLARSAIIGSGAGFAIQTIETGLGHLAEFPQRGNVEEFAASLARITRTDPRTLRSRTQELVARAILPHTSGVIATEAE